MGGRRRLILPGIVLAVCLYGNFFSEKGEIYDDANYDLLDEFGDNDSNGLTPRRLSHVAAKDRRFNRTVVDQNDGSVIVPPLPDSYPLEIVQHLQSLNDNTETTQTLLDSCVPTSQFKISRRAKRIVVQTLGPDGKPKTMGGDEFYVTYKDNTNDSKSPNAVARITDLQNGKYALTFRKSRAHLLKDEEVPLKPLEGEGTLAIHFAYTCGIGELEPPEKKNWYNGGNMMTKPETTFPQPKQGPHFVVEIEGYPMPTIYDPLPTLPPPPELHGKQIIHQMGDSVMVPMNFVPWEKEAPSWRTDLNSEVKQFRANLNMNALDGFIMPLLRERVERHRALGIADEDAALITGSCIWDLAEWNVTAPGFYGKGGRVGFFSYEEHALAMEKLITQLRTEFPKLDIYWKGCTVPHIEASNCIAAAAMTASCHLRTKYFSYSRAFKLDRMQKMILERLQVPIFDLFDLSYEMAEFHEDGDAIHFDDEWSTNVVKLLVPPVKHADAAAAAVM
mmetsp:Transcript_15167/g.21142  ORF Transcript_15167/g.21142 Transcript_15167/m.21142 type:complete len:504 (-) Transcript_15167:192-1703(-)